MYVRWGVPALFFVLTIVNVFAISLGLSKSTWMSAACLVLAIFMFGMTFSFRYHEAKRERAAREGSS